MLNLEDDFETLREAGDRRRVMFSFLGDLYQWMNRQNGLARDVIQMALDWEHPIAILTKGDQGVARDVPLIATGDIWFGASVNMLDDLEPLQWEPHAAPPSTRIALLANAHWHGVRTFASVEPVIHGPAALELLRMLVGYGIVDEYRIGKRSGTPMERSWSDVDWQLFVLHAHSIMERSGKAFQFKRDLWPYVPAGAPRWRDLLEGPYDGGQVNDDGPRKLAT